MNKLSDRRSNRLRIGAVSYLNTKPLIHGLDELLPDAQLSFECPSRLADKMAADELDVALVPSIELAGHPQWTIVSDACIGCTGPVLSVKLLFRVPPSKVKTLALDEGSRTSVVLAQILLDQLLGVRPALTTLPMGATPADVSADAVLVIGDRAIRQDDHAFFEVWDLGDRWCRWAELPFVFAMWVARPGVDSLEVANALAAARDLGRKHLSQIASEHAEQMQLPVALLEEYLSRSLSFCLGPQQRRGLELFYGHAAKLGLIAQPPKVVFDDCTIKNR